MRTFLIALALALPVEGLRTKKAVAEWSGLGGIPEEAANVMNALVSGQTNTAQKHLESMKGRISSFSEEHPEKQAQLAKAVKAMFPLTPETRKQIEAMKSEHPEIGQALLETKTKESKNPFLMMMLMVPEAPLNFGGVFTGLNPASGIETGPSGACYFYNVDFLPCLTFNVCMGASMGLATTPNWWAKSPLTMATAAAGVGMSLGMLQMAAPYCNALNSLVAPRMPPLNGMLWNLAPRMMTLPRMMSAAPFLS